MLDNKHIRVRFAPSPTGFLHVGGLRTALYNYLFARKHDGVFILRIEDTDRNRYVEGAVDNLIKTLAWAGLEYDEGPIKGGAYGPYIQSERLEIYQQHAELLIGNGTAYRCFCSPERLDEMRKQQEKMRASPKYDRHCLRLTQDEIKKNIASGLPYVVRMKIPDEYTVKFHDIIRDDVEFESTQIDDQVLLKSDGYPTYHLANVVDDHLMNITHVIRGEEWLSSTPKHVLLYQNFAWELPTFAHLPLLLNADRSKLSKRQGDVAVEDYKTKGYLIEALVNFVAMLGWNPGTEQEFFMMEELVQQFSLERVNKAGAIFNLDKLNWLNFEHLRKKSDIEVLSMLKDCLAQSKYGNIHFSNEYLLKIIQVMRERGQFICDYVTNGAYFFEPPTTYDQEVVRKRWKEDTPNQLRALINTFAELSNPGKQDYEAALHKTTEQLKIGHSQLIHATRLAVSGVGGGPGLYDILYILGRDECVKRIHSAIESIK